jgi:tRNA modification GTPase
VLIDDTIVAISSAAGPAARMIVRLSGPDSHRLLGELTIQSVKPGRPGRCSISFSELSVPVWVYLFAALRSYTSQDLVELHIPGNPLLARMLVEWLIRRGARSAEPGEFTARAYFSGKLDLAQSEGVAAAISAAGRRQLDAARRLMAGELSQRLRPIMELLTESLALSEVGIDFSEEDVQVLSSTDAGRRIDSILEQLDALVRESARFEQLSHEPTIVLAGRPNAGKSTLTNALAGLNRSIVSPIPGTTRDVLSVPISLRRGTARLMDVAGIEDSAENRPAAGDFSIESQMLQQAHLAIERADVLVLVRDATDIRPALSLPRAPDLLVLNKIDLNEKVPAPDGAVCISAAAGRNLDILQVALDRTAFGGESAGTALALTARHLSAINQTREALHRARQLGPEYSLELLAAEFRQALDSLGQILGVVTPDDVLGRIFSTFCIGK